VDKKSPIVRTIRRPQIGSDVLVAKSKAAMSADDFFSGVQAPAESLEPGSIVFWRSFCGVVGTGKVLQPSHVKSAWMVECTAPSPEVWQKAGVPAKPRDVCIVYDWQLVRDT